MIPLLVGAALGAAKYSADKQKEDRQRRLQAETLRYSPWSKLGDHAQAPTANANMFDIGTGALQGYQFGSQFGNSGSSVPEGGKVGEGTMAMNTRQQGQNPWMHVNSNPRTYNA